MALCNAKLQALATVQCASVISGQCQPLDEARVLALSLYNDTRYRSNPAILHYGIHAFDSPERSVFEAGVPFAEVGWFSVLSSDSRSYVLYFIAAAVL